MYCIRVIVTIKALDYELCCYGNMLLRADAGQQQLHHCSKAIYLALIILLLFLLRLVHWYASFSTNHAQHSRTSDIATVAVYYGARMHFENYDRGFFTSATRRRRVFVSITLRG